MAKRKLTDIQKLAMDVYNGTPVVFNEVNGEDAIRNLLTEAIGGEWNFYNYKKNQWNFFQVVSEIISEPMAQTLEGVFDGIAKTETIAKGDVKVVEVEDQDLFEVATISAGNNDISRQRVFNNQVKVETAMLGIKIYDDFDRFIAGRINFANLIARVKKSFTAKVAENVYKALLSSYDSSATAKWSKTGAFDEKALDKLIARVEGKTGKKCAIYGTKSALGGISASLVTTYKSDNASDEYLNNGFVSTYKTTRMIPIINPVGRDDEFALTDDYLFVLPEGEDIINVVFEGQPIMEEVTDSQRRADQQIEFEYTQSVGVAVLIAKFYGIYKITA